LGDVTLPIDLDNGYEIDLFPYIPPEEIEGVANPSLISATVTLYGPPCADEDPCPAPPNVNFVADNSNLSTDLCENGVDFTTGCLFRLEMNVTPGDCPILACFWSDGYEGCGRTNVHLGDECGFHEETLILFVADTYGCVDLASEYLSCCVCCTPSGTAILDTYIPPGKTDTCEYPPGEPFTCGPGPIGAECDRFCYYKLTFETGSVTNCDPLDNHLHYFVDWGNATFIGSTSPRPPSCHEPGTFATFQVNHGWNGLPVCIRIIPFDDFGCEGEPQYYEFPVPSDPNPECPPEA
jgi:hypothetical protein